MESKQLLESFGITAPDLFVLLQHVVPLLHFLRRQSPSDAGDELAAACAQRLTSYETLVGLALKDFLNVLSQKKQEVPSTGEAVEVPTEDRDEVLMQALEELFVSHEFRVWCRVAITILLPVSDENPASESPSSDDIPLENEHNDCTKSLLSESAKIQLLAAFRDGS